VSLPGHGDFRLLRSALRARVYEATRERDGVHVVVKALAIDDPVLETRVEQEFRSLRRLSGEGIVKALGVERVANEVVLIFEQVDGLTVEQRAGGQPLPIDEFLALATATLRVLARVHEQRVVHRDLKPSSIVLVPASPDSPAKVVLTDFGLAPLLESERRHLYDVDTLLGSLPYISPEMSGRTNRRVDARSDLYALGAIFYELLTSVRPFQGVTAAALINAHLTRRPQSIRALRPELPSLLSSMIMRLLEKAPELRYQSARGILVDLERFASAYASGDTNPDFPLGHYDQAGVLQMSTQLYGRANELATLEFELGEAFANQARRLVIVRGAAGLGKTALVRAFERNVHEQGMSIGVGGFEPPPRQVPYQAFARALTSLLEQLLTESEASLTRWRSRLAQELDSLAPVLAELVPSLRLILGELPQLPDVGPSEGRNRLHRAIARLLDVLAERGPLALVLDDLQWADAASLELLRALIRPTRAQTVRAMLVVVCVRGDSDPLGELREELVREQHAVLELELEPLTRADLEQLLADMLGRSREHVRGLAELVGRRSEFNPLFVRQLLLHLVDLGLVRVGEQGWEWDEVAIAGSSLPDDMLAIMTAKLTRVPERERELLQVAACIGTRFDPSVLEALYLDPANTTLSQHVAIADSLRRLVNEGLLVSVPEGLQFSHDHVQRSARDSLAPERRRSIHAAVGRYLLARSRGHEIGEDVFLVVDQLREGGVGVELLGSDKQRLELARLAQRAGAQAMQAAAWASARRYLEFGIELLRSLAAEAHDEPHELAFALYFGHAQVLALLGEHDAALTGYDALLRRPLGRLEQGRANAKRLRLLAQRGRAGEALAGAVEFLRHCDLELPEQPGRLRVLAELARVRWQLRGHAQDRLLALAPASDETALAAMAVLSAAKGPAYIRRPRLYAVLSVLHVRVALASGRDASTALAVAQLAVTALATGAAVPAIEQLCEAALALEQRGNGRGVEARTAVLLFVWPAIRPFRTIAREVDAVLHAALDAGDHENSGYLAALGLALHIEAGTHLRGVLEQHGRNVAGEIYGSYELGVLAELSARFAASLRSRVEDTLEGIDAGDSLHAGSLALAQGLLSVTELDATSAAAQPKAREVSRITRYSIIVMEAFGAWLLGEHDHAATLIAGIDHDFERVLFGTWQVPRCALLGVLATLDRAWRDNPRGPGWRRVERYVLRRRTLVRRWAERSAANYGVVVLVIDAELAAFRGQLAAADDAYERAIAAAVEQGSHVYEALACERFARHALRRGHATTARGALEQAHAALHRWGARAASRRLERDYPEVFEARSKVDHDTKREGSSADVMWATDNAVVLRILETIGQELRLDEVVVRVLRSACDSAGADHGALLLERDGKLGLVSEYSEGGARLISPPIELEQLGERVAGSAIHFVVRTGRALVIDDVALDPRFAGDPHVAAVGVRSLLCLPIDRQGQRVGALLLTSRLGSHVFTAARLELLAVLSDQAAHALENAQLYDALQRSEDRWRTLVNGMPDIITLIDDKGRIEFINHLGPFARPEVTPSMVIGMPAVSTNPPASQADFERVFTAALVHGERAEFDFEFEANQTTYYYQVRLVPIMVGGRVSKIVSIGTDVSARRHAERERTQLEAQLRQQQRLESIGTLASGVAHEINNPVQGIMNYADLIHERASDVEQVREFASEIGNESQRVATIVRNLLAFSRQEHDQQPEPAEVRRVVELTLSLIRTVLRKDEIELDVDIPEGLPRVRCRTQQIQQILMNLVTNARDAVNESRRDKHVWLSAGTFVREGRSWVRISVRDAGPGIPPAIRQRIFDPFFTTKRNDKGTGLGLAVSHGIAVDHGGTLEVESEIGVGTTFHLELPAESPTSAL
jgi:PAS domain S-box-containing protein